jgi:hypothetical protein
VRIEYDTPKVAGIEVVAERVTARIPFMFGEGDELRVTVEDLGICLEVMGDSTDPLEKHVIDYGQYLAVHHPNPKPAGPDLVVDSRFDGKSAEEIFKWVLEAPKKEEREYRFSEFQMQMRFRLDKGDAQSKPRSACHGLQLQKNAEGRGWLIFHAGSHGRAIIPLDTFDQPQVHKWFDEAWKRAEIYDPLKEGK